MTTVSASCGSNDSADSTTASSSPAETTPTTAEPETEAASDGAWPTTDLVLDPAADYGDKYADGILPVGDGRVATDGAQKGSVYLCEGGEGGGASERGPWFVNNDTEYDINLKIAVGGEVEWDGEYSVTVDGDERVISTNAVPHDHTTGEFPVDPEEPAYQYDRNPNTIEEQALDYRVSALPTMSAEPECMGGEAGVMVSRVTDSSTPSHGQQGCRRLGDPGRLRRSSEQTGQYRYHTLSRLYRRHRCVDGDRLGARRFSHHWSNGGQKEMCSPVTTSTSATA
ncbi:MAG: hypothetical protein R2714_07745 [Microthrixaceae bacterium]